MRRCQLSFLLLAVVTQTTAAHPQQSPPPKGETKEITLPSKTYPNGRHAWVYTPAGYPTSCAGACNLMIVFDGAMYLGAIPLPDILDSLTSARRTPPTVAILFDNGAPPGRLEDLANSQRFASFIANELMPWVRQNYAVTHSADRTIITGTSAGGLGATYIALKYPALFGNVLSSWMSAPWKPAVH